MLHTLRLLITLLFITSGCYAQKLKTYVHPTDGFEIGVPKKWVIEKPKGDGMVMLVTGPRYKKHFIKDGIIMVESYEAGYFSLEELYKDDLETFRNAGYEIQEVDDITINGHLFKYYYHTNQAGAILKTSIVFFTVKNKKVYRFTMWAVEDNLDELEPLFRRVAETIKLHD
ncbi:hypothetical protein [Flavobacterium coralii]|uniref:hypothetical protein n=1 Tax=Flavobacterium coralii TaxID=2838017 RepID=UPI000C69064B|nr:hypothetical protein [Flavobacterium sp.]|tara:strand:- start:22475 stop:22987 length:513 start_codon:yes stop_codon:yes gene_type:complete